MSSPGPGASVTRFLVARCDAWSLVAGGVAADQPAVTVFANRVQAANSAARAGGVVVGLRRREAQARCPRLEVLDADVDRDARGWESVIVTLDDVTPRVEVPEPGMVAFATRGPSRYFGGDVALADLTLSHLGAGRELDLRVGIADGFFAAALASRTRGDGRHVVVAPGASAEWLAPLPVSTLDPTQEGSLVDVLQRLGIANLGAFASLSSGDVIGRFGQDGLHAHRLASGVDPRPPDTTPIPEGLAASSEIDPPAQRVDQVAFLGKTLADQLHDALDRRGLACTRVLIEAETEHGEKRQRLWRHEGALSAGALADRVRWQLDGWLNGDVAHRPTAGITLLRIVPDEVVGATGRQLGFWGDRTTEAEAVMRSLARVQGLLGVDSVKVPEYRGGRGVRQTVVPVSAAVVDLAEERPAADDSWVTAPWPGQLPRPYPAKVLARPIAIEVVDGEGREVTVTGRGEISAAPATVTFGSSPEAIVGWAGPWLIDDRWWDTPRRSRHARMQVTTGDGEAHLVTRFKRSWWLEASYQ